jgi:hypothetical protein
MTISWGIDEETFKNHPWISIGIMPSKFGI